MDIEKLNEEILTELESKGVDIKESAVKVKVAEFLANKYPDDMVYVDGEPVIADDIITLKTESNAKEVIAPSEEELLANLSKLEGKRIRIVAQQRRKPGPDSKAIVAEARQECQTARDALDTHRGNAPAADSNLSQSAAADLRTERGHLRGKILVGKGLKHRGIATAAELATLSKARDRAKEIDEQLEESMTNTVQPQETDGDTIGQRLVSRAAHRRDVVRGRVKQDVPEVAPQVEVEEEAVSDRYSGYARR